MPLLRDRFAEDTRLEIGIDEAGRGSFWGPIMAGAVLWPPKESWTDEVRLLASEIRDSKKIAPKKRLRLATDIKRLATAWSVGVVSNEEIDREGITWANREAFRRAAQSIIDKNPDASYRLLIDGQLSFGETTHEQHTFVEGDNTYLAIGAASILAKVDHDTYVLDFCESNEDIATTYSLRSSKGYGTAAHREGLVANGAHALHRRTFIGRYTDQGIAKPVNTLVLGIVEEVCRIRL